MVKRRRSAEKWILDRSTLRRTEARTGVSHMAHWKMVQDYAMHIPSPFEHYLKNRNHVSGVLLLDGKYVLIRGVPHCILLAYDTKLGVVGFEIANSENITVYRDLVELLVRAGYPLQCIVSDGHTAISHIVTLQRVPHQRCIFHLLKELRVMLTDSGRLTGSDLILFSRLRFMLLASTLEAFSEQYAVFRSRTVYAFRTYQQRQAIRKFIAVLPDAIMHLSFEKGLVPRTSNSIENCIGQIEARLKTFRGVKSKPSLHNLLKVLFRFRNYH